MTIETQHAPLISAESLSVGYGRATVVRDVDIVVRPGELVALIGPNGAGKTTTLLALAGVLKPMGGVASWAGSPNRSPLHVRARSGLSFVPEERSVIRGLSVRENLLLAARDIAPALELFPELESLLNRQAGLLSGGEQQMLSLARALIRSPKAMLVDELSLGLAPLVVERLMNALATAARQRGIGVLLVEQQARRALEVSDRWYLMRRGRIVSSGVTADAEASIERAYLEDSAAKSEDA